MARESSQRISLATNWIVDQEAGASDEYNIINYGIGGQIEVRSVLKIPINNVEYRFMLITGTRTTRGQAGPGWPPSWVTSQTSTWGAGRTRDSSLFSCKINH